MTYKEQYPEFIQEIMEKEHGTKVLITNVGADKYLNMHSEQQDKIEKLKKQFPQWH